MAGVVWRVTSKVSPLARGWIDGNKDCRKPLPTRLEALLTGKEHPYWPGRATCRVGRQAEGWVENWVVVVGAACG